MSVPVVVLFLVLQTILRPRPDRRRRQALAASTRRKAFDGPGGPQETWSRPTAPVYAVNHVSLTVEDGEFVALVGPSGCGKTTTLNLVAGLIPITGGDIYIGDRDGQRSRPEGPRHRHGVPELRALPAARRSTRTSPSRCRCASCRKAEIDRKVRAAAQGARHHPPARAQAARAVGRPAAARGARPRAGARSRASS